jgi:peptidoglycan hydrolase-like protein with peptidoglycan-binding domain
MLALRTTRAGVVVAGALAFAAACSPTSASVTRAAAPVDTTVAISPSAVADPATSAAIATTAVRSATTVPEAPPTTVPPTTAPPVTEPPTTTTTAQAGPLLEVAPPLSAPMAPVDTSAGAPEVSALQQRLIDLGFWLPDTDGSYGWVTQQAVMAFQKYNGLEPSGTADQTTIDLMNLAPYRVLGQGWDQDMIEVDKTKQLLYVIQGGRTLWVMNTSTGAGGSYTEPNQRTPGVMVSGNADTPEGVFNVYSQQPNGWWKGDLGELYRPKFFKGGSAVHGAPKVPNYPASHGCVRVTPEAMDFLWSSDLMPMGMTVWVHT